MRHILLASVLCLAAGCVGGITTGDDGVGDDGDDGTPTGEAKRLYDTNVYPILTAKCGAGCHLAGSATSTAFVTPDVSNAWFTVTSYSSVVGNFTEAGAPILTKITTTNHNLKTYTQPEIDAIKAWLAQEVIERSNPVDPMDPPPVESPGAASARLISEWSGCLTEADFVELRFGEVWANKGSGEGACRNCHAGGAHGFLATQDNIAMFTAVSTNKFYLQMFFLPNVLDPANYRMETNTQPFYNVGENLPPFTEHPSFNPDDPTNGIGVSPIAQTQELYNRTMGYMTAGTCGPPRIPQ